MGLFDRFRKKVRDAASEVDAETLSAEEGSEEALEAINQHQEIDLATPQTTDQSNEEEIISPADDDDWEDFDEDQVLELPQDSDDE